MAESPSPTGPLLLPCSGSALLPEEALRWAVPVPIRQEQQPKPLPPPPGQFLGFSCHSLAAEGEGKKRAAQL